MDIKQLEDRIKQLSEELEARQSNLEKLTQLRRQKNLLDRVRGYCCVLKSSRNFINSRSELKPVIFAVGPLLAAGFFILLLHFIGYSNSIFSGLLGFVFGLTFSVHVLYLPSSKHIKAIEQKASFVSTQCSDLEAQEDENLSNLRRCEEQLREMRELFEIAKREISGEAKRMRLLNMNWRAMRSVEFELFLKEVFEALGYEVDETSTSGDQGVDLLATKHSYQIAIQVKGYFNSVGNAAVQQAYAGMTHYGCNHCAVVTNSVFTNSAQSLAESTGCVLIDENNLPALIRSEIDLVQILEARGGVDVSGR